jgi:putative SOS response-associated peptidase YedK
MPWFAPTYNAAPQSTQPVVRLNNETGKREFALMRWGLVPYWAKDAKVGYSTINARADEVAAKPLYREALKKRRCLIPADAFYEWQRTDAKSRKPFAFGMQSGEPYAFAGLWDATTRDGLRQLTRRRCRWICCGRILRRRCDLGRWMSAWAMCVMTILNC